MSILTLTHMPPSLLGNPEIDTPRSGHVTKKEEKKRCQVKIDMGNVNFNIDACAS